MAIESFITDNDFYLFGPMGVGKSTLVNNISSVCEPNYISIGNIVRDAVERNEQPITSVIAKGGKIPLEVVRNLVSPYIEAEPSYILDGVPRHPDEALWIKSHIMKRKFGSIGLVLSADDKTLRKRIQQRAAMSNRQETADRIDARLQTYKKNKDDIMDVLTPVFDAIIEIDTSDMPPAVVYRNFTDQLGEL